MHYVAKFRYYEKSCMHTPDAVKILFLHQGSHHHPGSP